MPCHWFHKKATSMTQQLWIFQSQIATFRMRVTFFRCKNVILPKISSCSVQLFIFLNIEPEARGGGCLQFLFSSSADCVADSLKSSQVDQSGSSEFCQQKTRETFNFFLKSLKIYKILNFLWKPKSEIWYVQTLNFPGNFKK